MFNDQLLDQLPSQPLAQLRPLCEKLQQSLSQLRTMFAFRLLAAVFALASLGFLFVLTIAVVAHLTGSTRVEEISVALFMTTFICSTLSAEINSRLKKLSSARYEDVLLGVYALRLYLQYCATPLDIQLKKSNLFVRLSASLEPRRNYFSQAWHLSDISADTRHLHAAIKFSTYQHQQRAQPERKLSAAQLDTAKLRYMQERITTLQAAVQDEEELLVAQKMRLQSWLAALQQELSQAQLGEDRAWGLIGVIGITLWQCGENQQSLATHLIALAKIYGQLERPVTGGNAP